MEPYIPQAYLNFVPLIRFIEQKVVSRNDFTAQVAKQLLGKVYENPAFLDKITDHRTFIAQNRNLVQGLLGSVFSPLEMEKEMSAVLLPFSYENIYASAHWETLLGKDSAETLEKQSFGVEGPGENWLRFSYYTIFKKLYGRQCRFRADHFCSIINPVNGLKRHYKVQFVDDFVEVAYKHGEIPHLSDEVLQELSQNTQNEALWQQHIHPHHYEFSGLVIVKLYDVTEQEAISSMKYMLLSKDSMIRREKILELESKICELYGIPNLRLGIVSFSEENDRSMSNPSNPKIWNSLIPEQDIMGLKQKYGQEEMLELFNKCVYHQMIEQGKAQVIVDLATYTAKTPIEELLLAKGFRSLIIAPLEYEGECLGGIEIASYQPGELNWQVVNQLQELLPVFSLAAKRSLEDLQTRLQSIIKEEYTAIHPAVEWRFRQAALKKLEHYQKDLPMESEKIVFEQVYPIYGQCDIRNSSVIRNQAIQHDLLEQIALAREVLSMANQQEASFVLEEAIFRIDQLTDNLTNRLGSGDETQVLQLLKQDIEPLILHVHQNGGLTTAGFDLYFKALDPQLGILYKKRKAFEESLTMVNEMASRFIEAQQQQAQQIFPHYFEKYKTDGVEYTLYLGSSIAKGKTFNPFHLEEIKLWQLSMTARLAQLTSSLRSTMPVPLETTHLILATHTPLAIRFREEEKKFDVDGAYNIRYEIIKKRIDKANIRYSQERVTQPGKIAIVYNQEQDAIDYKKYLAYLHHKGLLDATVEELDIEALQGVNGLKALRVAVLPEINTQAAKTIEEAFPFEFGLPVS
jgi:hypothetical protein